MIQRTPLEQSAINVCNASAVPPRIYQLPPEQGRKKLDETQNTPVYKYPANISSIQIKTTNGFGTFPLYCAQPENMTGTPSVIFYIHGAGWVFGNFQTLLFQENCPHFPTSRKTLSRLSHLIYAELLTLVFYRTNSLFETIRQ